MIENKDGRIRIEGSVLQVLEDFSRITEALFEMFNEDIGADNARRVIANCCYVATLDEQADDDLLKELAQDTHRCITEGLDAKKARG